MKDSIIVQVFNAAGITVDDVRKVAMFYVSDDKNNAGILFSLKSGEYLYSQIANYNKDHYVSNTIFYASTPSKHNIVLDTLKQGGSVRNWQTACTEIHEVRKYIYDLKRTPSPTIFHPVSPETIRRIEPDFNHRSYEAN